MPSLLHPAVSLAILSSSSKLLHREVVSSTPYLLEQLVYSELKVTQLPKASACLELKPQVVLVYSAPLHPKHLKLKVAACLEAVSSPAYLVNNPPTLPAYIAPNPRLQVSSVTPSNSNNPR